VTIFDEVNDYSVGFRAKICGLESVIVPENKTILSFQVGYEVEEVFMSLDFSEVFVSDDELCPVDHTTYSLVLDQEMTPLDFERGLEAI
jgi:hypothetical protein